MEFFNSGYWASDLENLIFTKENLQQKLKSINYPPASEASRGVYPPASEASRGVYQKWA